MAGISLGYKTPACVFTVGVRWTQGWPPTYRAQLAVGRGWPPGQGRAVECKPGGWLTLGELERPVYPWTLERLAVAA